MATRHQLYHSATRQKQLGNSTSINNVNSRNAACKLATRHQLYSKTTRQHGITRQPTLSRQLNINWQLGIISATQHKLTTSTLAMQHENRQHGINSTTPKQLGNTASTRQPTLTRQLNINWQLGIISATQHQPRSRGTNSNACSILGGELFMCVISRCEVTWAWAPKLQQPPKKRVFNSSASCSCTCERSRGRGARQTPR